MRQVNASEEVGNSKFGHLHLMIFMWYLFVITFEQFDIAMYGVYIKNQPKLERKTTIRE